MFKRFFQHFADFLHIIPCFLRVVNFLAAFYLLVSLLKIQNTIYKSVIGIIKHWLYNVSIALIKPFLRLPEICAYYWKKVRNIGSKYVNLETTVLEPLGHTKFRRTDL